jgi:kynurenine formamidase
MARVIDLTMALRPGMRGAEFETARELERDGWNARMLHLYSHAGTHMDAPSHFGIGNQTIDTIPLSRCMGPAWIADVGEAAPRTLIHVDDLGDVADKLQPDDGLLIKTGWSARVMQPAYRDELPRVSLELARWCVEHQVRILGVEPPSVADVHNREELTAVHTTLLEAGIIIVEGLTHLDAIAKEKVTFMAFPLKIAGGDGSPARAFAVVE